MNEVGTPVVFAAFGTRTRARMTYAFMHREFSAHFPNHEILWAYTARSIPKTRNSDSGDPVLSVKEALSLLASRGHERCILQSLHVLPAWEFHHLIRETRESGPPLDVSVGAPLLAGPSDYVPVLEALGAKLAPQDGEAVVLVGHGTDHPSVAMYETFNGFVGKMWGPRVWMELVQWAEPQEPMEARAARLGVDRVRFVPFLIVAGEHVKNDVMGPHETSWRNRLRKAGVSCVCDWEGLGMLPAISLRFSEHVGTALSNLFAAERPKRFKGLILDAAERSTRNFPKPTRAASGKTSCANLSLVAETAL